MPVVGLALGALLFWGGAWLLKRRPAAAGGRTQRDVIADRVKADRDSLIESSFEASLTLGGVGAVIAGPVGAAIGAVVGFFAGAIYDWASHETYGRRVRDAVAQFLRENGWSRSTAAVDAMILRNALLGASHVWVRKSDLAVAIEIVEKTGDDPFAGNDLLTSLGTIRWDPFDYQTPEGEFLPGYAGHMSRTQILGLSPGQTDGPSQRRDRRAWHATAKVGDLYLLEVRAAQDSWRTTGGKPEWLWFGAKWPRVADRRVATLDSRSTREQWVSVRPSPENVDALARWFDRAAGVNLEQPS